MAVDLTQPQSAAGHPEPRPGPLPLSRVLVHPAVGSGHGAARWWLALCTLTTGWRGPHPGSAAAVGSPSGVK